MLNHTAKTNLVRAEYQNSLILLVSSIISTQLWIIGAFTTAGLIKLGNIGARRLNAILETVAAVSCIIAFYLMIKTVNAQRKHNNSLNKSVNDRYNNTIKSRKNFSTTINIVGMSILVVIQTLTALDLWAEIGINTAHKKLGLNFTIQNIFDTVGLSLLFVGLLISSYNKCAQASHDSENNKKSKSRLALEITMPVLGLTLSLLGKVLTDLEGTHIPRMAINNGQGYFPLALTLRIAGAVIGIISLLAFELLPVTPQQRLDAGTSEPALVATTQCM